MWAHTARPGWIDLAKLLPSPASVCLSGVMGIITAPSGGVNGVHLKPRAQSYLFPGDLHSVASAPLNSAGGTGKEFSSWTRKLKQAEELCQGMPLATVAEQ